MKLGLAIGYSGRISAYRLNASSEPRKLGYDSVWSAGAYGFDAISPLAFIAAQTKRIRLGSGVTRLPRGLRQMRQCVPRLLTRSRR